MNIVICDDNKIELEIVSREVEKVLSNMTLSYKVYKINKVSSLFTFMQEMKIDILIIDIELSKYNGMDIVENYVKRDETLVIFVTNYENFVYTAVMCQPFGFVRKSHISDLGIFIKKAVDKISDNNYIIKLSGHESVILKLKNIIFFDANKNYVNIHMTTGEIYSTRNVLKKIAEELNDKGFFRIHSGYLINLKYVHIIGKNSVTMKYNDYQIEIPISRIKREKFLEVYFNKENF